MVCPRRHARHRRRPMLGLHLRAGNAAIYSPERLIQIVYMPKAVTGGSRQAIPAPSGRIPMPEAHYARGQSAAPVAAVARDAATGSFGGDISRRGDAASASAFDERRPISTELAGQRTHPDRRAACCRSRRTPRRTGRTCVGDLRVVLELRHGVDHAEHLQDRVDAVERSERLTRRGQSCSPMMRARL